MYNNNNNIRKLQYRFESMIVTWPFDHFVVVGIVIYIDTGVLCICVIASEILDCLVDCNNKFTIYLYCVISVVIMDLFNIRCLS